MGEFSEFAEALLDQISVEINEEKEIAQLAEKINTDSDFPNQFIELESFSNSLLPDISKKIESFKGYVLLKRLYSIWSIIEDCAKTYNLWGVNDEQEWEDPAELEERWDFNLHMAECFRDQGYDNVADPNPFNPEIDLSFYIDEDWELREEDPIVQTWMKCEEIVEEEHGLTEREEEDEE